MQHDIEELRAHVRLLIEEVKTGGVAMTPDGTDGWPALRNSLQAIVPAINAESNRLGIGNLIELEKKKDGMVVFVREVFTDHITGLEPDDVCWFAWWRGQPIDPLVRHLKRCLLIKVNGKPDPVPSTAHPEGKALEWITPSKVAELLGIDETTVRRHCKAGDYPCHNARKTGGRWKIPRQDVEASIRYKRPQ